MSDDLRPRPGCVIPGSEVEWRFTTSSGPGGQHANRSSTRAEARLDLVGSPSLTEDQRRRLVDALGHEVRVSVDETRSQFRNRAIARQRLEERLAEALTPSATRRPPRGPSRGAHRRRLEAKRRRGDLKRQRSERFD